MLLVFSKTYSSSFIPTFPISLSVNSFLIAVIFSWFVPVMLKYFSTVVIWFCASPLLVNSSSTFSIPILSNLSIATVISIIFSAPPAISASAASIFLLFIFSS